MSTHLHPHSTRVEHCSGTPAFQFLKSIKCGYSWHDTARHVFGPRVSQHSQQQVWLPGERQHRPDHEHGAELAVTGRCVGAAAGVDPVTALAAGREGGEWGGSGPGTARIGRAPVGTQKRERARARVSITVYATATRIGVDDAALITPADTQTNNVCLVPAKDGGAAAHVPAQMRRWWWCRTRRRSHAPTRRTRGPALPVRPDRRGRFAGRGCGPGTR